MAIDRETFKKARNDFQRGRVGADLFAWLGHVYRELPSAPHIRRQAEFYLALAHFVK